MKNAKNGNKKIRQQKESGLPIVKWCERESVSYHTFNDWREKLGPVPPLSRTSFKALSNTSTEPGITIEKKGIQIHSAKQFDPSVLSQCLKALDKLC